MIDFNNIDTEEEDTSLPYMIGDRFGFGDRRDKQTFDIVNISEGIVSFRHTTINPKVISKISRSVFENDIKKKRIYMLKMGNE